MCRPTEQLSDLKLLSLIRNIKVQWITNEKEIILRFCIKSMDETRKKNKYIRGVKVKIISLFFPSFISVLIKCSRNEKSPWKMNRLLLEYGINVLINVWITMVIVVYIFDVTLATIEAFERFSFFVKYNAIAVIIAIFEPYVEEIIKKYIHVTFNVRIKNEKK